MIHNIQGKCPACGCHTLFIASGGYPTCSRHECPNPSALAVAIYNRAVGNG